MATAEDSQFAPPEDHRDDLEFVAAYENVARRAAHANDRREYSSIFVNTVRALLAYRREVVHRREAGYWMSSIATAENARHGARIMAATAQLVGHADLSVLDAAGEDAEPDWIRGKKRARTGRALAAG